MAPKPGPIPFPLGEKLVSRSINLLPREWQALDELAPSQGYRSTSAFIRMILTPTIQQYIAQADLAGSDIPDPDT
jgi:hypothetical protein